MEFQASKTPLADILPFRALYLQETNFQVRYNATHERGWSDSYRLLIDGHTAGYASVKGRHEIPDRDDVFECYIVPHYRQYTHALFRQFLLASGVRYITCQSNDLFLSALLYEFSIHIKSEVILFDDFAVTTLTSDATFRPGSLEDEMFEHKSEPVGAYVLVLNKKVIATGGFLLHYNKPFADLYMEVLEDSRKQGYGSFLIQEIKKACYLAGRKPAARCNITNPASKATLLRAGMRVCGYMLEGEIPNS
ncbi:GNAT family N-acetyltransferase [Chitinophaga barathri]|uniref:GNAT family N-acetyltransferase n=1 Tax=Chitinophaga barathri TaxID=1647451 RepID=A0A3N4M6U0_9BACT|nr:GNAT family N-acetyltransferase [Chitinophaga barathri]RPD39134.1 GNAT family N-acetyltransferase [Chitinophaga barathri]